MRSLTLLAMAVGLVVVLAGTGCAREPNRAAELEELDEVIRQLEESFIDRERLSDEELGRAAIQGILEYLDDPYTSYLTPEQYRRFAASLEGDAEEFEGIGAEVTVRDGRIMILGPLPGSPASRAGIRSGDVVLAVDGRPTEGMGLLETVELIRGPKGSAVVLRILRVGELRPIEVTVVRETIQVSSVQARMQADDVGYVRVATFDAKTAEGLRSALAGLRSEGAAGVVLDLRNNTGGLVDAAVAVVSEFVESGAAFVWRRSGGEDRTFEVSGEGTAYELPLVVLVNGFSASGSEIVAGAVQDHGRGAVVGTRTFGKGSVNVLNELGSGAGLYVTTARWLTPNGRLIEGEGIEPDVVVGETVDVQAAQRLGTLARSLCDAFEESRDEVELTEEMEGALVGLCEVERVPEEPAGGDAQLDAAVRELRKAMSG